MTFQLRFATVGSQIFNESNTEKLGSFKFLPFIKEAVMAGAR